MLPESAPRLIPTTFATAPVEKPYPNAALQSIDAPEHGRVVDAQGTRRRRQRAAAGDGQEVAYIVPFHPGHMCKNAIASCKLLEWLCDVEQIRPVFPR